MLLINQSDIIFFFLQQIYHILLKDIYLQTYLKVIFDLININYTHIFKF